MLYNFVLNMLGGSFGASYAFIPYTLSAILLLVFVAVFLNFLFGSINQFLFKS